MARKKSIIVTASKDRRRWRIEFSGTDPQAREMLIHAAVTLAKDLDLVIQNGAPAFGARPMDNGELKIENEQI